MPPRVRRLVQRLCRAATAPQLQAQQALWLGLVRDVLLCSPQHVETAALCLPLSLDAAAASDAAAAADAEGLLLEVWQMVARWTASPEAQGLCCCACCCCCCMRAAAALCVSAVTALSCAPLAVN